MRTNNSYNTLEEIIEVLSKNPNGESVWVGKNYSKADLIQDLKALNEHPMYVSEEQKKIIMQDCSVKLYGGTPGGGTYQPSSPLTTNPPGDE